MVPLVGSGTEVDTAARGAERIEEGTAFSVALSGWGKCEEEFCVAKISNETCEAIFSVIK
jgi:hypothetical protein